MNNQKDIDNLSSQMLWGYQCQVNGCEEAFLTVEGLADHLISELSKTHITYADRIQGLRDRQPIALLSLSTYSAAPVVMWQGRCIKAVNRHTALSGTIANSSSYGGTPGNAPSAAPKTAPSARGNEFKHKNLPISGYRCPAQDCDYLALNGNNILRHLSRAQAREDKGMPHKVFYQDNQYAVENKGTTERLKLIDTLKCKVIRTNTGLVHIHEPTEQQSEIYYRQPSETYHEERPIPQNSDSVIAGTVNERASFHEYHSTEWVTQSDFSDLACYSPIEPYPHEQRQENPASLPPQEARLSSDDPALDAQTDSFSSFLGGEFPLCYPVYNQNSLAFPDSEITNQDLVYLDQEFVDMRVHSSIDPDMILLTPVLKRRGALNSSEEVKRRRTML